MLFHWQNLNDKPAGRTGWGLIHGRCWLRPCSDADYRPDSINAEWHLGGWRPAISFRSDDEGVHFHVGLPGLALYLSLEGFPWLRRMQPKVYQETTYPALAPGYWAIANRAVSLYIHSGMLWWRLWTNPDEWHSKTPRWRDGNFSPMDFFFGRTDYSTRDLSTTETVVPMPERAYPCTVRLFESTWQRPRWPWPQRLVRADVDVPGGIPHPGKGENSWDCGEDATYSMTCPATTVEQAVARMVESVLKDRRRYGGSVNWESAENVG